MTRAVFLALLAIVGLAGCAGDPGDEGESEDIGTSASELTANNILGNWFVGYMNGYSPADFKQLYRDYCRFQFRANGTYDQVPLLTGGCATSINQRFAIQGNVVVLYYGKSVLRRAPWPQIITWGRSNTGISHPYPHPLY